MNLSLSEVEALCRKAARGAGLSWGLADEAGRACRWLASHDLPGAMAMADHLERIGTASGPAIRGTDWSCDGALCPVRAGAGLCDHADGISGEPGLTLHNLRFPLLLLPFADEAARHLGRQIRLTSAGFSARLGRERPACDGTPPDTIAQLSCAVTRDAVAPAKPAQTRADLAPALYKRLDALAQRTYAPATEASRLAGAGAGLTDND